MIKKRFTIKEKGLKKLLKKGGRVNAREDFYELLRRSVKPGNIKKH